VSGRLNTGMKLGERLHLPAVRHVAGDLAGAVDRFHIGTLRHQMQDHFVVAARLRMVQRGVALVFPPFTSAPSSRRCCTRMC